MYTALCVFEGGGGQNKIFNVKSAMCGCVLIHI